MSAVAAHWEDVLQAVLSGWRNAEHAEVTDETRRHVVPPATRGRTRWADRHILKQDGGELSPRRTDRHILKQNGGESALIFHDAKNG